jgi:hypothetical protein
VDKLVATAPFVPLYLSKSTHQNYEWFLSMSDILARKWLAARVLHEQWRAPFELLDQIMGRATGSVEKNARLESWSDGGLDNRSVSELHAQLATVFGDQLERFQKDEQSPDAEKRARALSILAKTLESIAAASIKIRAFPGDTYNYQDGNSEAAVSGSPTAGTAELDRQLTELVTRLAQTGQDR